MGINIPLAGGKYVSHARPVYPVGIMGTGPGAHAHMGPKHSSQKERENKHTLHFFEFLNSFFYISRRRFCCAKPGARGARHTACRWLRSQHWQLCSGLWKCCIKVGSLIMIRCTVIHQMEDEFSATGSHFLHPQVLFF